MKLKKHYLSSYKNRESIVHNQPFPGNVDHIDNFVDLNIVDADEVVKDVMNVDEMEYYIKKHYKSLKCDDIFSEEHCLFLISGVAGIGKTCFIKKCLLDWANGLLWKNHELVFYLECRELNQYKGPPTKNDLIKIFYKDIFSNGEIPSHGSVLFVVDGLDEFVFLDELFQQNPKNPALHPVVNTLLDVLNPQHSKCVLAGRVESILSFKSIMKFQQYMISIQIMGFNEHGVQSYINKFLDAPEKSRMQEILKASQVMKAMSSVPFILATLCAIISSPTVNCSFKTMTELYINSFLYFVQNHGLKYHKGIAMYKLLELTEVKEYILKVCELANRFLIEGKVSFTEKNLMGGMQSSCLELPCFIETFETNTGKKYKFSHISMIEFCSAVHIFLFGNFEEVWGNERLRSCLPMVFGLCNANRDFISSLIMHKNLSPDFDGWLLKIAGKYFEDCW